MDNGKVLTAAQLAELVKLHEELGRLLATLREPVPSGLFKRNGLTQEQSDALIRRSIRERSTAH